MSDKRPTAPIRRGQEYVSQSTGFRVVVEQCDGENVIYELIRNSAGCYSSARDFLSHYALDESTDAP